MVNTLPETEVVTVPVVPEDPPYCAETGKVENIPNTNAEITMTRDEALKILLKMVINKKIF
ncbi:MAG: hypothetical protein OHK0017_10900 [Patescibacteria group bacterium]